MVVARTDERAVRRSSYLVHRVEPAPGDTFEFRAGVLAKFVEVTVPDVHMPWAVALHNGPIRALQIGWRDRAGHSPWCPDFDRGGRRQPVLGVRGPGGLGPGRSGPVMP